MTSDIARQIHAKVSVHSLYLEAKLAAKAPLHFSARFKHLGYTEDVYGKKVDTGMWERWIDGVTFPRASIFLPLCEDFPRTKSIYTSSLWKAIRKKPLSPKELVQFFKSLTFGIKRVLGAKSPSRPKDVYRTELIDIKALGIYKYLNEDSLACLIVLMKIEEHNSRRYSINPNNPFSLMYGLYERLVYVLLAYITNSDTFIEFRAELYKSIVENVIKPNSNELANETLWAQSPAEFCKYAEVLTGCIKLAKVQNHISSKSEEAKFLYHLLETHPNLVFWELVDGEVFPNAQTKIKGLHWLLNQMSAKWA